MPETPSQYDAWPTGEHVRSLLTSAGFWPVATADSDLAAEQAGNAVAAAAEDFASGTGWHPLLSNGEANETRYYDTMTPRGIVLLEDGLLQLTSVSLLGRSVLVDSQVFAKPNNAVKRRMPFTQLEFYPALHAVCAWPCSRAIAVTGEWGRFRAVPRDAWNAVLRMAAVNALASIDHPRALAARSEDGFSEEYDVVGAIQPRDILGLWPREYERIVAKYRRVGVG